MDLYLPDRRQQHEAERYIMNTLWKFIDYYWKRSFWPFVDEGLRNRAEEEIHKESDHWTTERLSEVRQKAIRWKKQRLNDLRQIRLEKFSMPAECDEKTKEFM
jgi:hypothetical protein